MVEEQCQQNQTALYCQLLKGIPSLVSVFSEAEHRKRIAALKYNKVAGIDDVLVDQLKNLGPRAHTRLFIMLSIFLTDNKMPTLCRQSKMIAILKPGKDSVIPKRPIFLLCHTYKLYERMILNRVTPSNQRASRIPSRKVMYQLTAYTDSTHQR